MGMGMGSGASASRVVSWQDGYDGDDWVILRMAGPRTLTVVRSLEQAGFEVWTPVQTTRMRVPRSKRMVEKQTAILPTFAFARANRVRDLLAILALPVNPHPRFSVLRHDGRVPMVNERQMQTLRAAEASAKRALLKKTRRVIEPGTAVHMEEGSYAGLRGVVERGDGKFATVRLGGKLSVKIATFLLIPDGLEAGEHSPNSGPAARLAA